jgi:hypothetical protein
VPGCTVAGSVEEANYGRRLKSIFSKKITDL